jgi:hypothetical protein
MGQQQRRKLTKVNWAHLGQIEGAAVCFDVDSTLTQVSAGILLQLVSVASTLKY